MSTQNRDNTGTLWLNTKRKSKDAPILTGAATVGGRNWRVAVWKKKLPSRKPFLSLAFTVPQPQPKARR